MPGFKKYTPVLLIIAAMAAGACTKGSDAPQKAPKTAGLNVINAVTDVNAVNFYLNGTRQNTNSAIFLGGTSGYNSFPLGEQTYQFKVDSPSRTLLAEVKLTLPDSGALYTAVLTGQRSANNLTTIFTKDAFTDTGSRAHVRFIQASPGTQAYDVLVGDTLSFQNQSFKSVTSFMSTGPGKKTVKVMAAGTSTVLFTTSVTVLSATYYTLFTYGQPGKTGKDALAASLILNR